MNILDRVLVPVARWIHPPINALAERWRPQYVQGLASDEVKAFYTGEKTLVQARRDIAEKAAIEDLPELPQQFEDALQRYADTGLLVGRRPPGIGWD